MTRAEKRDFRKWANGLSNKELEDHYYAFVLESLGSQAEEMYERGFDMADVLAQEKYERDLCVRANILEEICGQRGIKLWEEGVE